MNLSFRAIFVLGIVLLTSSHFAQADVPRQGATAEGEAPKKERPYHPEPRVIVNVLSVKGPHDPARVQHDARFGWKRIVRCYKAHSPHHKVLVTLYLVVSREGSLARAQNVRSDPANRELEGCLADALPGLSMPKAAANSTAQLEIKLAPGDPPIKN